MKNSPKSIYLFVRYFSLFAVGMGNLYIFHKFLIPITVETVRVILSVFTKVSVMDDIIYVQWTHIQIAPACVAGSAFYLLLILILSISDVSPKIRAKAIVASFGILFALNIVRILILIPMTNSIYFYDVHWIFWHLISTLFVVFIWFYIIKKYNIKSIPVYSDLKYLMEQTNSVKNSKRKSKNK